MNANSNWLGAVYVAILSLLSLLSLSITHLILMYANQDFFSIFHITTFIAKLINPAGRQINCIIAIVLFLLVGYTTGKKDSADRPTHVQTHGQIYGQTDTQGKHTRDKLFSIDCIQSQGQAACPFYRRR